MKEVIKPGAIATTCMTVFSCLVSAIKKQNYNEPSLLAQMAALFVAGRKKSVTVGWMTHYFIGLGWATVYQQIIQRTNFRSRMATTLAFGTLSGLVAVAIWKGMFRLHPLPPYNNRKEFYRQLFIAHLVFAACLHPSFSKYSGT